MMEFSDQQAFEQWQQDQFADDDLKQGFCTDTARALLSAIVSNDHQGKSKWQRAARRLAVLAHFLDASDCGRLTLTELAEELTASGINTTKATLSVLNVRLKDSTGFTRTEKSTRAREIYSKRAFEIWQKRKNSTAKL
jgi:hypothetical protein